MHVGSTLRGVGADTETEGMFKPPVCSEFGHFSDPVGFHPRSCPLG
jgi:hypothetical protein